MVRFKNRWLLIEFIPVQNDSDGIVKTIKPSAQTHIEAKHIWGAIKKSVLDHFGDVGWGSVGLSLTVKYYSPMTHICIVRVARDHYKVAWAAVTMLRSIEGMNVLPNVVHLSGTIKHAQMAAIEHNRVVVGRYRTQTGLPAGYKDSHTDYLQKSEEAIQALKV